MPGSFTTSICLSDEKLNVHSRAELAAIVLFFNHLPENVRIRRACFTCGPSAMFVPRRIALRPLLRQEAMR